MRASTTLVINTKGGSGKTTVTTNLASYFASRRIPTAVMDFDPQGSSLAWLALRNPQLPRIHGCNAAPQRTGLRSFAMHVPAGTQQLIIDAPAGASGVLLQDMLARADAVLIPVASSTIDIRATANFIRDLLLTGPVSPRLRSRSIRLGVIANKVRKSMPVYEPLERFLASLSLPLLARLSDSDAFLKAAETGQGIFEMDFSQSYAEREQFLPVAEWVEQGRAGVPQEKVLPFKPLPRVSSARGDIASPR
ncbi:MAG TPA: ParA family protein [Burkholderiales bacterium]|nr:ParA family protein [Burkholderiales bacterium]